MGVSALTSRLPRSLDARVRRGNTDPSWIALPTLAVLSGAVCGLAASRLPIVIILGLACGCAWLVSTRRYPGVALGLWVLLATNTIPFVNVDSFRVPGAFRPEDAVLLILVVAAGLAAASGVRPAPLGAWLRCGLIMFGAAWLMTLVRSWLADDIPVLQAALFGRDFLFYATTLVAARYLLCRGRSEVIKALATMTGGALIYALAQIAYQVTGVHAGWIVHPHMEDLSTSVVRTYQNSTTLVWLLVPITLAVGLGTVGRWRGVWLLAAVVLGLATLFDQTRASYIGMAVGILVVMAFMFKGRWAHSGVRRLYVLLLAIVVAAAVITPLASSSLQGVADTVANRATSIVAVLGRSGEAAPVTWSYRQDLAHDMLVVLGPAWPIGLGFLHPATHYVAGLPEGSIRNSDLGLMQVLMTMGVLGLALLLSIVLVPAGSAVRWLLVATGEVGSADLGHVIVSGAVASVASALAASMTLGTFAEGPSAMVAGVIVAVVLIEIAVDGRHTAARHWERQA